MSILDGVGSQHESADAYQEAREALDRLGSARDWSDWAMVGADLAAGRAEAMRTANTNRPRGAKYNRAFGDVLKREQLGTDELDSATRNQLLKIEENKAEIEAWRERLEPTQRLKLNHPSAIWRHWQRTQQRGGKEQADVVEQSGAEAKDAGAEAKDAAPVSIIAPLTTLVQQMGQRGFTEAQLDDLLAAKITFTSNDLIELAAGLNQLATAWQERAKNPCNTMIEETSR